MGFLDHSTNNIILDGVLTDLGRQYLARNDGSFSIVKFAAGDDEVDYSIIQKFGRTVGKEKIEKNTPVFEALTNQNHALKYPLVSMSNPNLTSMTVVSLTGDGLDSSGTTLSLGRSGAGRSRRITLTQSNTTGETVNVELRDQSYVVKMPNDLVQLTGITPDTIDSSNIATYVITRDATSTSSGGSQVSLNIEVKSITDSLFSIKGSGTDKSTIDSAVTVTGLQSGASNSFAIQVSR